MAKKSKKNGKKYGKKSPKKLKKAVGGAHLQVLPVRSEHDIVRSDFPFRNYLVPHKRNILTPNNIRKPCPTQPR